MSERPLKKILCVEDEKDIQDVARIVLEVVGGFKVEICGSGSEALQKVVKFSPDLILLDVMMPEMDGLTVMRTLRENTETSHIPVVFMTAKVFSEDIDQYRELGALGVIRKPFDATTLSEELNRIWSRHHE